MKKLKKKPETPEASGSPSTTTVIQNFNADLAAQGFEPASASMRKEAPWHGEDLSKGVKASEPEPDVTERGAVLREAEGLITGDRNKSYGSPTENFTNIADLWNVQFRHKLRDGETFTATDVAMAMIHVKQARLIAQPKRDNFVDIAGYAACGWETQSERNGLDRKPVGMELPMREAGLTWEEIDERMGRRDG